MRVLASIQYRRLHQIGVGQGRNSTVYLADEPQLGGRVVVKEIPKKAFPSPSEYFGEARVMFASAHRNVLPIQYACQTPQLVCLVMPHCQNGSLQDRISKGPLPPVDAIRVFLRVLNGVAEIHNKGFIHYDLKPSNILFDSCDEPLVADFGQSRPMNAEGVAPVPPFYRFGMTPEMACLLPVGTVEADIYQVGLSLYRAVNGDPTFNDQRSETMEDLRSAVASGSFPDRNSFLPHVPKGLRTVIRKALKVDPKERFGAATEFIDALGQVRCDHNWQLTTDSSGSMRWESCRDGRAKIEIDLTPDRGRWQVLAHTEGKERRRLRQEDYWASGLTYSRALHHLKKVFDALNH